VSAVGANWRAAWR